MPFEWASRYETGDERVDSQHRQLFAYADQLEAMIAKAEETGEISLNDVEALLDFLEMYVNVHFAYEEICMAVRRCAFAAQNREAHRNLQEFYTGFRQDVRQNGVTLEKLYTLHSTLGSWLVGHICGVDVHLKDPVPPAKHWKR